MDFKRIFRGPWLWIVLGVVAVISILSVINGNAAGEQVDTSEAVAAIRDGSAKTVLFVDGDQEVQIVMDDGSEIRAINIVTAASVILRTGWRMVVS